MRKRSLILAFMTCVVTANAQQVLTLDSCRALALRNNKQINVARLKQQVALNTRKAARTNYLPKVDVLGTYQFTSREISLLNNSQKANISNIGTLGIQQVRGNIMSGITQDLTGLVEQGTLTPEQAQQLGGLMQKIGVGPVGQYVEKVGNTLGNELVKAFRTDTRNVFGGAIMLRQPIYMGGAITAANKMAAISEQMAENDLSLKNQSTLFNIDNTYWLVVSLKQKEKLALSYRDLVKKLDDDVQKMIKEGVATRADGLKVDVKVNEADMKVLQVEDGLSLAKMLLCQLCGLPLNTNLLLADENNDHIAPATEDITYQPDSTLSSRPEIRLLQNTVDLSKQTTKIVKAAYLPHVALTGGYMISNPNVYNGFQKKFSGVWNIGVLLQVPIWNWGEAHYKVRASKTLSQVAQLELSDIQEKINLQIAQSRYKLKEANKRLIMANNNIKSANENLRVAQLGFKEGVIGSTEVLAAQTAWQKAQSQKIDADIDVKLSQVSLKKALGILY